MLKFTLTAKIYSISPILEKPTRNGQPFQWRELVLDDSWEKDGRVFENYVLIQFTGDVMNQLDNFQFGEYVTIDALLTGRVWDGKVFNTVKGRSISPYKPQQNVYTAPAPMQVYPLQQGAPVPTPLQNQQQAASAYPPQQPQTVTYQPSSNFPPTSGTVRPTAPATHPYAPPRSAGPGTDDLPF